MKKINVLMTGGGSPGGPGVINCLQKDKDLCLWVGDADPRATGKFLNKNFVQLPKASDGNFIDFIQKFSLDNDIKIIFPLVTMELFRLAEEKEKFEKQGILVIVSDYKSLEIANNKSKLLKHLESHGIPIPRYKIIPAGNFSKLENAFQDLGHPESPVVIKPSISNGSRGVRIVDNSVNKFDLLFEHKPNSLYIAYDELTSILKGEMFPELLASEFLPGDEFTVDTIVGHDNKAKLVLPRIRSKMSGGISTAGCFIENKEIIEYCHQIINSLKLYGPIGIQVKCDKDGKFKILEINPRIQGTSVAGIGAGVNLPLMAVYQAMGMPIEIPEIQWGRCFARYWNEVYF